MKFGIVVFPGSNCDHDAYHAAKHVLGQDAEFIWHKDTDLKGADVVDPSRRVFVRRLSAHRSHRAFLADHARRAGVRRPRRPRARRLQRLSDSARGRADSRRDAAQSQRQVPVRAGPRPRRADRHAVHGRVPAGPGPPDADRARRRQLLRAARRDRAARSEPAGRLSLHERRRRGDGRGEPERIGRRDRRPVQRGAQRRRPHAAPGAGVRVGARQRRRAARVRVRGGVAQVAEPWWRAHDRLEGARTARPQSGRVRAHRRHSWAASRT